MTFSDLLLEFGPVVLSGLLSAYVAMKITQAVMNERINNLKDQIEKHKVDLLSKIDDTMGYIEKVEQAKADKSEVSLAIDLIKRVDQKIDQLTLFIAKANG